MLTRILVNGARGKMGQEVVKMVQSQQDFELVDSADKEDDLAKKIQQFKPQIVIDFTHPTVGFQNTKIIIDSNVRPVIGTTGFNTQQIEELKKMCAMKKLGGIIAPNFSIGAVLMMKYAQDAAKYFPQVEIIELHHDKKVDFPSGTAIKTAEMMAAVKQKVSSKIDEKATLAGARGAVHDDIHIHSVRLPGMVADQQVIFGGIGETLTISHHTIHREAFMPGVAFACRKVMALQELVYGLEQVL